MVAWHDVPGKAAITVPSRRERCDLWRRRKCCGADTSFAQGCGLRARGQTVPYGTDSWVRPSRHFVPGYHHVVPPGQIDNLTTFALTGLKPWAVLLDHFMVKAARLEAWLGQSQITHSTHLMLAQGRPLTSHLSLITLPNALRCFKL